MKKELIFTPVMLAIGILMFLLSATGMAVHIAIAVIGIFVLAVYTAATKKEWKIPALEIIMRVCYGVALITGPIIMKVQDIAALKIVHKASCGLFLALLVVLFIYKLIAIKKANK